MTDKAKEIVTLAKSIYTEHGKGQYFTARYAEGGKTVKASTKRALAHLVKDGWLDKKQLDADTEGVLGYKRGVGRPPRAYRLVPKMARSVAKAIS